ncbi:MAG: hemerythrin domain-containing protein [Myxococcales bacterium]|nr:hemerythrin domain-containing protein [Myxococcales bacterium]MBK7196107.1 hemerythrin domain-containing protein [Myxococcales bacterium]MBP6847357.1 hemerythrin domain-containing protein [Kofleriaceae bacterium]
MDAVQLLKDQHDAVDRLFAMIEEADDGARKAALFVELADALAAHVTIEEDQFYPAVKAKQTADMLLEATEEHLAIKRVLADLLGLTPTDPRFTAKLKVLQEEVTHHAREEEEAKLFPKVRRLLDADELEALGGEMSTQYEALLEASPRFGVPGDLAHAAAI